MTRMAAVIGANWGDEGKGLMTDYLARPNGLVVRFNGGAQAGHTVVTPDRVRHIFSHIGSGTFRGAATLLSRFFILNPVLFVKEHESLEPWSPRVYVDPLAQISTPYDMLLNRAAEDKRGEARHGSCGVGINETVTRCEHQEFVFPVAHAERASLVQDTLDAIIHEWVPQRAAMLDVPVPSLVYTEWLRRGFLRDLDYFLQNIEIREDAEAIAAAEHVVFEGAQGLQLDANAEGFPHVTRSRTGLTNVSRLLNASGHSGRVDVYYVSRTYFTRHGAGPLPGEMTGHPFGWSGPETNRRNRYQGEFRYAPLQPAVMREAIAKDLVPLVFSPLFPQINRHLALTCFDQVPDSERATLIDACLMETGVPLDLLSSGPTREHVMTREVVDGHCLA